MKRRFQTLLCAAVLTVAAGLLTGAAASASPTPGDGAPDRNRTAVPAAPVGAPVGAVPEGTKATARAFRGTLAYVPLDTRPVSYDYAVATLRAAGWDVEVPPKEFLSSARQTGRSDQIFEWLEEQSSRAVAVVASADTLIYGGLVDSRTHHYDEAVLASRAERLLNLKKRSGSPDTYIFVTIMRSPKQSSAPEEPVYYKEWGARLFRQGALRDQEELTGLRRRERKELAALDAAIPAEVAKDYYGRRALNLKVTELLMHGVENESFDYMLIGRDDTAPLSQAHNEARDVDTLVGSMPRGRIRFFSGADQLGLLLLTRAVNRLTYTYPLIYTQYAPGKGPDTIPSYEDDTARASVGNHIFSAGAFPTRRADHADFLLAENTPYDGVTPEATSALNTGIPDAHTREFLDYIDTHIREGRRVIVADTAFGNGADKALVQGLFARGLAYKVAAYDGWNTPGNALGYALAQGILSPSMSAGDHRRMLEVRYLDDWAYQTQARQLVAQRVIWPQGLPAKGLQGRTLVQVEDAVQAAMVETAEPLLGDVVHQYRFVLPWQRLFEVQPLRKE